MTFIYTVIAYDGPEESETIYVSTDPTKAFKFALDYHSKEEAKAYSRHSCIQVWTTCLDVDMSYGKNHWGNSLVRFPITEKSMVVDEGSCYGPDEGRTDDEIPPPPPIKTCGHRQPCSHDLIHPESQVVVGTSVVADAADVMEKAYYHIGREGHGPSRFNISPAVKQPYDERPKCSCGGGRSRINDCPEHGLFVDQVEQEHRDLGRG